MAGTRIRNRRHGRATAGVLAGGLALASFVAVAGWYGTFYVAGRGGGFCGSCHSMEPYREQWAASAHKDAACSDCHTMSPGLVTRATLVTWTGGSPSIPRAEVHDESCLDSGCHDGILADTDVGKGGFSHAAHMRRTAAGASVHCTSCHPDVGHAVASPGGEAPAAAQVSAQETCYLCHLGNSAPTTAEACLTCHEVPGDVTLADGTVLQHQAYVDMGANCSLCHTEVTEGHGAVPDAACARCHVSRHGEKGRTELIHNVHVTEHYIDCAQCHESIHHGAVETAEAPTSSCAECHGPRHDEQQKLYMGLAGRGVKPMPSRMYTTEVSCRGCHGDSGADHAQTWDDKRQRCVECHGAGFDAMLDDWKALTDRAVAEVAPTADFARSALAKGGVPDDARKLFDDAVHNFDLVRNGRAVHNPVYALALLKGTVDQTASAAKLAGLSAPRTPSDPLVRDPGATCTSLCHDRIGVPASAQIDDLDLVFPHRMHLERFGLSCTTCHPADKHRQVAYDPGACSGCHHMAATNADTCSNCHPYQRRFLDGAANTPGVEDVKPDPMAEKVNCLGCHDLKSSEPLEKSVEARCTMCHGEDYGQVMAGWKERFEEASKGIPERLDAAHRMAVALGTSDPKRAPHWKNLQTDIEEMQRTWKAVRISGYAHNPDYVLAVLHKLDEDLGKAEAELELK